MSRLILLISILLLAGCGGEQLHGTREDRPGRDVDLAVAAPDAVAVLVRVPGTVEPWVRTSPGTKLLGRVAVVAVREGDRVREGGLLARLEDADLKAAVEQAEAAVAMAEAGRENAHAQHARMVELHRRGSVTDKNLEDATAGIRVADAALQQARAALSGARVNLGYAEIRSPISGWVVARRTEVGDMAAPGVPLFTLEDLSRVKVVLQVPESDVVGLQAGMPATVEVDVLERELPATIHRVVPAGDPTSRTYEVQLVLDNPDGDLKSGMFARGRFRTGTRDALRVPRTAVVRRGQLDGLFVVDEEGAARLRWVRLGRTEGDRVLVLSGLQEGERYVVDPPADLLDDTPVVEG